MAYDPFTRGAAPVGVRTLDLPAGNSGTLATEVWYPATERDRGADLAAGSRDTFSIAPGLPTARQNAVRNAAPQPSPRPLVMYWHGGYGHRREASNLCTHLASHGYVVAAPDFPGDHIRDTLAAADRGDAKIARTPIDESARARPRQAVATVDALRLAAPALGLAIAGEGFASCGISMGGFTALAVNSIDRRCVAAFAVCPMYGTRGPIPQVHRLQQLLRVDDWRRPVDVVLLTGELDPLVVLPDMRELYAKLPEPKRFAVLGRAGHMHFGDGAAEGHERFRAAYLSGAFPDPEIDAIALGTAMRPFAELCTEADALATVRALCVAQMDAVLKNDAAAHAFRTGDLAGRFAARGIALEAA